VTAPTLRERLAAKQRRRVVVPVQVSDPGPAREALDLATRKAQFLELAGTDPDGLAAAQAAETAARAALAEHYENVEFQAIAPVDAEAIFAAHTNDAGETDDVAAAPELAAACAVDEELRDVDWWREQLTDGTWSLGERVSLYDQLVTLNMSAPRESVPKG